MELRLCHRCHLAAATGTVCASCGGPLQLADQSAFLGQTFGKYRLDAVIGAGGMGVVYRATHATLGRPVALKIVLPELRDDRFQRRFAREAQLLAELKHPNIVEVYDFDVSAWGIPYIVMEYLPGASVRQILAQPGPALDLADWAPVLRDVAAALDFAHRKGVVHRDLKPENLFVARYDERLVAKVLDFGIARILRSDDGPEVTQITRSGAMVGTINYLSPEQLLGEPVGPAADQYALALTIAELALGRPVRAGKSLGEIARDVTRPLPEESFVGAAAREPVRAALRRATAQRPGKRFPSASRFVAALGLPTAAADDGLRQRVHVPPLPSGPTAESTAETGPAATATDARAGAPTTALPRATREAASPATELLTVPHSAGAGEHRRTQPKVNHHPGRRRLLVWTLAAAALVAVAVVAVRMRTEPDSPSPEPATRPLLELRGSLAVPADTYAILDRGDRATYLLAGPDCVYQASTAAGGSAVRVPLGGTEPLGSRGFGTLFLRQGRAVGTRTYVGSEADGIWAAGLPAAAERGRWVLSPAGSELAILTADEILLAARRAGSWQTAARIRAPAGGWERARGSDLSALARVPIALSRQYLAVVDGGALRVYATANGRELVAWPFGEPAVTALAIDDGWGQVAIAGWFPEARVYPVTPGAGAWTVPTRGQTPALAWIGDYPTLAVGDDAGVRLVRAGREVAAWSGGPSSPAQGDDLLFTGDELLALDRQSHQLHRFAYHAAAAETALELSADPLWAVASDDAQVANPASAPRVYVGGGGTDGRLFVYDPSTRKATPHPLHDLGITALATDGQALASASDDKSIAVRALPSLDVVWRSQAHGFLVNHLRLAGVPLGLWSASSDGTVKRWGWPQLGNGETVADRERLGERLSFQSLWVAPAGDRLLAGSWQSRLLDLARGADGAWQSHLVAVDSPMIYSMAPVARLDAVLLVGAEPPHAVYLYDLAGRRLARLEDLGALGWWAVAAGDRVYVAGLGGVLVYDFAPTSNGGARYRVARNVDSDFSLLLAGATLGSDRLALGSDDGRLQILPIASLTAPARELALPITPESPRR